MNLIFKLYNSDEFKNILKQIYHLNEISIFNDNRLNKLCPFYCSKHKIVSNKIFNIPFQFCFSPNLGDYEHEFFRILNEYSINTGKNIIIKALKKYNYKKTVIANYNPILELNNSYENTYKQFSKNHQSNIRRNINKSNRFGLDILHSNDINDLKKFYYNVFAKQYIHKHMMVFQPYNFFKELFLMGIVKLFVAKKENKIYGGIIMMEDNSVFHYNYSAMNYFKNVAIGTLLINRTIQHAIDQNMKYYDFGSTPLSDKNLLNYKLKWGSINYPVYYYYTLKKPQLHDLHNSMLTLRKIYSKIPEPIIHFIIPKIIPWLVQ